MSARPSLARVRSGLGLLRSVLVYYAVPGRAGALRRFYRPLVPSGSLCFDVGAHVGNRIRAWRQLGARVVAVEPQPACLAVLRLLYGRDPGVTLVPAALGASPGAAEMLVSQRHPTLSTLSPRWAETVARSPRFAGVTWDAREPVEVTTLDHLGVRFGTPDFVKIDVEGAEAEVLAGLSTPLRSLSFEYVPAARPVALACLDRLGSLGDYVYNRSEGESLRLHLPGWVEAPEIRAWLGALPAGAPSGDVYARLRGPRPGGVPGA